MSRLHVITTVNGDAQEFLCEPGTTLLDALRGPLGLTGSKEGCGSGDCGACTVTLDGEMVCACLVLAPEAQGRRIETIEGMAGAEGLHPLQQQFLAHGALQCGFCTPGVLVAAKALLDVLRDNLGLTGSKEGCGSGDCGACSVMIDDRLVCSCLVLAPEAEGVKIETIEGMAEGDKLHPLQKKFVEMAALQCGICTPGFLIASKALLARNLNPTETEVRYWLAGNLCRCTGYDKIIRAVLATAAQLRQERSPA